MATRLGGQKSGGAGKGKGRRKAKGAPEGAMASGPDGAGIGHNIGKIREEAKRFFDRIDHLNDAKEGMVQSYNEDIKGVVEEAAAALGRTEKVIRAVYTEHRREIKRQEFEAKLDIADRAAYAELRDAFGSESPFGAFAASKAGDDTAPIDKGATGGE